MSKLDDLRTQMTQDDRELTEIQEKDNKKVDALLNFSGYDGVDKIISSYEALDIIKGKHSNVKRFKTGISRIDYLTDGFEEGELVVLSGITANGKTTFAQTLTRNLSKSGVNSLWFTYEVGLKNFIERFGKKTPLFFLPKTLKENTVKWIEDRIIESKVKYECKVVFIDHLHYLIRLGQAVNTSFLIGEIMRKLKQLAIEHEIVIVIIAHTQKIKHDTVPDLSDIRDSSFISQESDICMIIRRCGQLNKKTNEMKYFETANVYLLKNRRKGDLGKIELTMKDKLFYETEVHYES